MNVLGKIKSKKQKVPNENPSTNEKEQKIEEYKQPIEQKNIYQTQVQHKEPNSHIKEQKEKRIFKTPNQIEYMANTNVLTKQKEIAIRQKLSANLNSPSNSFSAYFLTKKPSKNSNSGVYFDENTTNRSTTHLPDSSANQRQKNPVNDGSYQGEEEFTLDFDFLLSNREKKEIKKSLHQSKGKVENVKEIENQLKLNNHQVLCYYVKKWTVYGDIFMLDGQLQSLKNNYIEIETQQGRRKVFDKIKVKLSCGRDILTTCESIGRIYLSNILFLSQNEAMIIHEHLLHVAQKTRGRRKC